MQKRELEREIENKIFPGQKIVQKVLTANPNIDKEYEKFLLSQ